MPGGTISTSHLYLHKSIYSIQGVEKMVTKQANPTMVDNKTSMMGIQDQSLEPINGSSSVLNVSVMTIEANTTEEELANMKILVHKLAKENEEKEA